MDKRRAMDTLPGAKLTAKQIKRTTKLAITVKNIKFSPDGSSFAAATTEGLVVYSLSQ